MFKNNASEMVFNPAHMAAGALINFGDITRNVGLANSHSENDEAV